MGRLFRTGTSVGWSASSNRPGSLTSGCSTLSQLLGLWAISGESGGMLGTGWEGELRLKDLTGHPRGDALKARGPKGTWGHNLKTDLGP